MRYLRGRARVDEASSAHHLHVTSGNVLAEPATHHAEAQVRVPVLGVVPVPIGAAQVPGLVVPGTAPHRAGRRASSVARSQHIRSQTALPAADLASYSVELVRQLQVALFVEAPQFKGKP